MKRKLSIIAIMIMAMSFFGIFPINASAATLLVEPPGNYNFGTATIPYDVPEAHVVTATRSPSTYMLTGSLSGDNPDCFTLSTKQLPSIADVSAVELTVIPKAGLAAGSYTATVGVEDSRGEYEKLFDVSFTVSNFGVPLTGVPDVAGDTIAMIVFAIISSTLWVFFLNCKFKRRRNV